MYLVPFPLPIPTWTSQTGPLGVEPQCDLQQGVSVLNFVTCQFTRRYNGKNVVFINLREAILVPLFTFSRSVVQSFSRSVVQ